MLIGAPPEGIKHMSCIPVAVISPAGTKVISQPFGAVNVILKLEASILQLSPNEIIVPLQLHPPNKFVQSSLPEKLKSLIQTSRIEPGLTVDILRS